MLFTPDGLEQATRLEVAARHAQRFRAAGVRARARPRLRHRRRRDGARRPRPARCTAVDADERDGRGRRGQPAALAGRDHGRPGAPRTCDLPSGEGARHAGAWLDPARRTPGRGRRPRADPAGLQPRGDLAVVDHGAAHRRASCRPPAPSSRPSFPHAAVPPGAEAQWTSWPARSLECARLVGPARRSAGAHAPWSCAPAAPTAMRHRGRRRTGPPPTAGRLAQVGRVALRAGPGGDPGRADRGAHRRRSAGPSSTSGVGYVAADQPVDAAAGRAATPSIEAMPLSTSRRCGRGCATAASAG